MSSSKEQKLSKKYEKHIRRSYKYLKVTFELGTTAAIAAYFTPLIGELDIDSPWMDPVQPLLGGLAFAAAGATAMYGSMSRSEKRLADRVAVDEIAVARSENVFPADWAVGSQRALEKMVQRPDAPPPTHETIDE
jgi:hypothetical protein